MTVKEILEQLFADREPIIFLFIVATTLIQIAPIQINPWSAFFKWLGKQLNKEVIDKVDTMETRLNKHINNYEEGKVTAMRRSILNFASTTIREYSESRTVSCSKEMFEFMISECDRYEKYCNDNNIPNGVAITSIKEIRRIYQECVRSGYFLTTQGNSTS